MEVSQGDTSWDFLGGSILHVLANCCYCMPDTGQRTVAVPTIKVTALFLGRRAR